MLGFLRRSRKKYEIFFHTDFLEFLDFQKSWLKIARLEKCYRFWIRQGVITLTVFSSFDGCKKQALHVIWAMQETRLVAPLKSQYRSRFFWEKIFSQKRGG